MNRDGQETVVNESDRKSRALSVVFISAHGLPGYRAP